MPLFNMITVAVLPVKFYQFINSTNSHLHSEIYNCLLKLKGVSFLEFIIHFDKQFISFILDTPLSV
jgi:hypothetical protein